jgi:hypothetical protein
MAIIWIVEWDDLTPEQFEQLKELSHWEEDPPDGLQHQVTAFSDKALVLTQLWQSPEHVMRFMEERLLPAVKELGISSMPRVDQHRVHSVFQAGLQLE